MPLKKCQWCGRLHATHLCPAVRAAFEPGVGFPHTSASKPPRKRKPVRKKRKQG